MRNWIVLLGALSVSSPAFSHEEHGADDFNMELTLDIFEKVIQFTPELMEPKGPVQAVIRVGGKLNGKDIYLNSNFWELVRSWIDLYHAEVKRDCENCVVFDREELLKEAKDLAAQGFFSTKLVRPISKASEHIATETADIGARLGNVALVAKVSSEIAETVLSKTVGGGGVHVLCTIIDAAILFGTRHVQVGWRMPSWGIKLGAGYSTPIKYWLVSKAIHRAQKRVRFESGPIEFDEEAFEDIVEHSPVRKPGWWRRGKNHREEWLKGIQKSVNSQYEEIAKLNLLIEKDPQDSKLQKRKKKLEHNISKLIQLKGKQFVGARYKRFFFFKARRGSDYLSGEDQIEKALNKNVLLWIASAQQNILNRAMVNNSDAAVERENRHSSDEILNGLAEETLTGLAPLEAQHKRQLIRGLLTDVEFVFDKSQPAKQRYLYTLIIESVLTRLTYKFVNWQSEEVDPGEGGWWSRVFRQTRFHWRTGQFVKHVYEYTDFLRLASVSSSEEFHSKNKYEAMEGLLRIFAHLEEVNKIFREHDQISEMSDLVKEENLKLFTYKPWSEKRMSYRGLTWRPPWVNVLRPYPQCSKMWDAE